MAKHKEFKRRRQGVLEFGESMAVVGPEIMRQRAEIRSQNASAILNRRKEAKDFKEGDRVETPDGFAKIHFVNEKFGTADVVLERTRRPKSYTLNVLTRIQKAA